MGAIDNLETLKRTGRISSSTALVGSLLSIKPVVELRDGKVEQESRQRTRSKSLDYVIDKAAGVSNIKLFSILNGAAKDYESFKTKMLDKVSLGSDVNIVEADIGPIIGSHVGQGAVGFACLTD
jgi:fatty acid-binding protein DegV